MLLTLITKVKTEYFQKHMPHGAFSKYFGNFENHAFQIKEQILTKRE